MLLVGVGVVGAAAAAAAVADVPDFPIAASVVPVPVPVAVLVLVGLCSLSWMDEILRFGTDLRFCEKKRRGEEDDIELA